MTETVTPLVVRTPAPGVSVIELVGDVTGASETAARRRLGSCRRRRRPRQ